jgi:hypothetical protein
MAPRARKAAAIATFVGVAAAAAGTALPFPNEGAGVRRPSPPGVHVTGSVDGLFPGSSTQLPVRIHNRHAFAVVVRSVTVRVGAARRGCPARVVRVGPFRGRLVVAARGERLVRLKLSMLKTSPDACRGARFPLRFRAAASRR